MKTKICYIVSKIDKSYEYEWLAKYLDKEQYELSFILLNKGTTPLEEELKQIDCKVKRITFRGKVDFLPALFLTWIYLLKTRPSIVNCNLLDGTLIGLLASFTAGIRNRVYTRHHSTFHHQYYQKGVMYDKLSNSLATHIVAITGNVKDVLVDIERVKEKKVTIIPYGFDFGDIESSSEARVEEVRTKHGISEERSPVIGVISRYTHWKGVQYIIPAFKRVLEKHPNALLVLSNAKAGEYKDELNSQLQEIDSDNYVEIRFENDVASLYSIFDLFVHVPIDIHSEAFGRTYVETLISRTPSVLTKSGIARDFVHHEDNALVVDFCNEDQIYQAILRLLEDKALGESLATQGYKDVERLFSIKSHINKLQNFYSSVAT